MDYARQIRHRIEYKSRSYKSQFIDIGAEKNVLIITVDCLRYDRVTPTYHRDTAPFLNQFGMTTSAISAAPWTFPSVPSILSGRYPHKHGAIYPDDSSRNQDLSDPPTGIRDDVETLADILDTNGYSTWFDTAITTASLPIRGRFAETRINHSDAVDPMLDRLFRWWSETDAPKFGYVQLGDLHEPLAKPTDPAFGPIPNIDGVERWRFGSVSSYTNTEEFDRYRAARELFYDTIVHKIDKKISEFLCHLDEREDTVIIITSDHGEEFWEFDGFEHKNFEDPRGIAGIGHGHALVPPVLEVPIITNIPIQEGSQRASSVDIVPTILKHLGASPPADMDGTPLQTGRDQPPLSQEIAYGPNQFSVTDRNKHLIHVPINNHIVCIDFETGEELPLPAELPADLPTNRQSGRDIELSDSTKEHLSDLGYAE